MATKLQRGPVRRISGIDTSVTEDVLKAAMQLLVPEDQTQRQAFVPLMPYLYVLRRKGCSWAQLTKLLTDCGFNLLPSTVRSYYSEELAVRQDLCEARLAESLVVIAETKKAANGADLAAIAGRVSAAAEQLKAVSAAKLDAVFGSGGAGAPRPLAPPLEAVPAAQEAAMPPPAENKKTGLRPAPTGQSPVADGLKTKDVFNSHTPHPALTTLDDDPVIPVLKQKTAASPPPAPASSNSTALPPQLICQKLQEGATPLEKRDTVAVEIYQPGNFEHPAIPGLLLTLDQRLYGAALEYCDTSDGVIKIESAKEKRFRVTWVKPIPMTNTTTGANFTKMNESLFKKNS